MPNQNAKEGTLTLRKSRWLRSLPFFGIGKESYTTNSLVWKNLSVFYNFLLLHYYFTFFIPLTYNVLKHCCCRFNFSESSQPPKNQTTKQNKTNIKSNLYIREREIRKDSKIRIRLYISFWNKDRQQQKIGEKTCISFSWLLSFPPTKTTSSSTNTTQTCKQGHFKESSEML